MSSPDPSANGGVPPKSEFEMHLESVEPDDVNLESIPAVEAVEPAKTDEAEAKIASLVGMWEAIRWIALFAFVMSLAIVGVHFKMGALGITASVLIWLVFVIYSATRRGFGFGKAFLWSILFMLVTQGTIAVLWAFGWVIAAQNDPTIDFNDPKIINSPASQEALRTAFLVSHGVSILFSLLILRCLVGKEWRRRIALRRPSLQHLVLVLVAMPALLLASNVLDSVIVRYIPSMKDLGADMGMSDVLEWTRKWPLSVAILAIGVGPALGEELWCRGFLGDRLASRYGLCGGVLLTSFLFGMIHVEPQQAIAAMIIGIVLHLTYLATRSILVPMLIHFLNNSLIVLSITGAFPFLDTLETAYNHRPAVAIIASLFLLSVVAYALHRTRARVANAEEPDSFQFESTLGELPRGMRPKRFVSGSLSVAEVGVLVVAAGLFAAIWFGL
jgi:membrane protease YdiL (CAAX protease family)